MEMQSALVSLRRAIVPCASFVDDRPLQLGWGCHDGNPEGNVFCILKSCTTLVAAITC
ncbi:hypothetical protein GCM10027562_28240 [Arthrobacter pigmenti]